jgi:L-asparagine transporter-like permease
MFLTSLLYTLALTRKNFPLKDFLLKSQTSQTLIGLTFLTAITLTINCLINTTLLTLNSLSTTQAKTQKFPNSSIPDLLARVLLLTQFFLIISFSPNFKNQTQNIYSGITKIVGLLLMIVAFCIELCYNKLISINPEFFRINSLLLNTEIHASITIIVVMAIVFSTYVLCFGGYECGRNVYRTLYISVVSLLIT